MTVLKAQRQGESVEFFRYETLPLGEYGVWRIQRGLVRSVTWDEDGNAITLGLWGPGQVVGMAMSLVDPYELQCLTGVQALPVDLGLPQQQLQLVNQIQLMEQLLGITRTRRLPYRLVKLLQWLGERFGTPCESGWLIPRESLPLTHQLISELIGTTRVTVTRALGVLSERDLFARRDRHLFVRRLPPEEFLQCLADWTDAA
jgi:CRP-like cAMP-binding protein